MRAKVSKQKYKHGILPVHRCKDDDNWLDEKLSEFSYDRRKAVCGAYSEWYRDAYAQASNEMRRENAARFAANSRLRWYLAKVKQNV